MTPPHTTRLHASLRSAGIATLLALLTACVTRGQDKADDTTFVVVRHAEKATDDPRDPGLSAAGEARAQALAQQLDGTALRAVYATAYRRTQSTARPSAQAHGLGVQTYAADMSARAFADNLRRTHAGGTVLVVGHSNTVPALVAALCGCAVAPMREGDFDNLYRVRITRSGAASMAHSRY